MTLTLGGTDLDGHLRRHHQPRMNDAAAAAPVTYADVEAAAARLEGVAHRTPVATSQPVRRARRLRGVLQVREPAAHGRLQVPRRLQRAGAARRRRARSRGVVAFSSGNHAQAVALAGRLLGIPHDHRDARRRARGEGRRHARLRRRGRALRPRHAARTASRSPRASRREKGAAVVPPFDHPAVIAGQGTAAKELIEDVGPLDYLFVCCGGAGLLSGCADRRGPPLAGHRAWSASSPPRATTRRARSARKQLVTHRRARRPSPTARARSRSARSPSRWCCAHVHDIITVTDAELVEAMRFLWERMKLVVEPTGALATAGVLQGAHRRARPARRHHPVRRQRRPQGDRRALRLSALAASWATQIPLRGSALDARVRARGAARCSAGASRARFPNLPKFVIAVAPHTSNWDFVVGVGGDVRARPAHRASSASTRSSAGRSAPLMRWMGGIPVDRSSPHGVVGDSVAGVRARGAAHPGDRARGHAQAACAHFKSGFLQIARGASVPVVLATLDYDGAVRALRARRSTPGEDIEAERGRTEAFFAPVRGKQPRASLVRARTNCAHRAQRRDSS